VNKWMTWYLKRQIKMTLYVAQHWGVWVCGHCGRAVSTQGECLCARQENA
jgi:hypothetical protein